MNCKTAAIAMVAVMIVAGAAVALVSDDSTAKVVNEDKHYDVTLETDDTVGHNATLFTDEYQYSAMGYTMEWFIAKVTDEDNQAALDGIVDWKSLGSRTNGNYISGSDKLNDVIFTMTERQYSAKPDNVGEYNLNIKAGESANAAIFTVAVKCAINVNIEGLNDGYSVSNLYYLYDITVTGPSKAIKLVPMTFTTGVNGNIKISVDSNTHPDLDIDNYNWYAVDLPAGLSMSIYGTVIGTPHNGTDVGGTAKNGVYTVDVIGSAKADSGDVSDTVECTLSITILAGATGEITLGFTEGSPVKAITTGKTYVTETGSTGIKLTVNSELPFKVLTVKTVDSNGNIDVVDGSSEESNQYDITVNGNGIYRIYVTSVVNGHSSTDYVDLYVVGNLDSVFAEIIVSGA